MQSPIAISVANGFYFRKNGAFNRRFSKRNCAFLCVFYALDKTNQGPKPPAEKKTGKIELDQSFWSSLYVRPIVKQESGLDKPACTHMLVDLISIDA